MTSGHLLFIYAIIRIMTKKYEILEHPAELRFRIYGKTIEELFSNAAEAMADTLAARDQSDKRKIDKKRNCKNSVSGY